MLPTLVIALREGLEAALVVAVIAAFLRRHGRPLRAMWVGVVLAVVASFAIGGGLLALESALPQAAQEGMEAVIGLIAVVFVTTMVLWMTTHARNAKRDLEAAATRAIGAGTSRALAVMAFLAVLKEGFETSVFLIATFRAAVDPAAAALGAVLGLVAAVLVGVGIATGGVRMDLRAFYRWTSPFLILLAGGLLLTAVRKAHGAGWIDAGQQPTVDLSWLAPRGSVLGALVTGVLGIPPDPRLVEAVAWLAYVIPVSLLVLWPAARRPQGRPAALARWSVAAGLAAAAVVLVAAVPSGARPAASLPIASGGSARMVGGVLEVTRAGTTDRVPLAGSGAVGDLDGIATRSRTTSVVTRPAQPASVTLDRLVALSGGRVPVGISPTTDPGPFDAAWTVTTRTTVVTADGSLVDATRSSSVLVTLTGGGLDAGRTVTVPASALPTPASWRVAPAASAATVSALVEAAALAPERRLWGVQVPVLLLLVAAALVLVPPARARRRVRVAAAVRPPVAP